MKTLLNYHVLEKLGHSMHSEVFKVHLPDDASNVLVLRRVKAQFSSDSLKDYLQQQIQQLKELSLSETVIPDIIDSENSNLFLVHNYSSDISMSQWLTEHKPPQLEEVLNIFISIAQQLENRHKTGHIHKGIKPNNILLNSQTLSVQLIDDVRILDINQLSHFIYDEHFRVHTLPYLTPEQTGRIKYSVNYTTDLYALGMILFEALTGKPPFLFDDPVSILHSHLAETPPRVENINSNIPEILGDILERLLEKAPEKRYQTASGLKEDLLCCLSEWKNEKHISRFTLGHRDYSNRITIPSLMVGRDDEKNQMLDEFKKTCSGVFRSALISGLSGIGKTRLIQELQLPIVVNQGYFCSGKFDQFKKHIPYSTLIQAFTYLVKTLLTEDEKRLEYWKTQITERLGENARLMTNLIPELVLIIGEQAPVADLPPIEARNRFNDIAGKFIACFARKEHPLTLFIDDLQWCDGASFDLFEQVFDNHLEYPYLFWIGAYRHNEVDSSHRLTRLINRIHQANRPLLAIRLEALGLKEVNHMTAYILNTYPSRTDALSNIIYHTSAGNPLFVNECLRWLHTYKHLHLNEDGIWDWDDKQLRHAKMPDSAIDLFKDKISKLSLNVQTLLGIAASLGARFDSADLALVAGLNLTDLYQELKEAFEQNILLREKQQLIFFHDQVQAAAESFLDASKKQQIHHKIATAFINAIPKDTDYKTLPNLFSIVEHLSKGRLDKPEKEALFLESQFNYEAGIVAMQSLATDNANFFFHNAKTLYPYADEIWDKNYDFLFSLHKYLARTEMALGNQVESETILDALIQHSRSDIDRIDCLYEQTTGLSSLGNFTRAIKLGNRGLDFFKRRIPDDDKECLAKAAEIFEAMHKDKRNVCQEILNINPSVDRDINIETGIYSELIPDYYLAGMVPQLYLSAIQSTQNCLAGGVDESVIYGFSMMGLYLQRKGEYQLSFRYEDLGLALAERYPDTFGATKGINGILWTNRHNRESSKTIIEECQQNIHRGKNCGDLYNAGLSYGPYIWHLVNQGNNMQRISEIADECIIFSKKFNLSLSLGLAQSALMGWSAFMQIGSRQFNDDEIKQSLTKWEHDKHVVSIGGYYTLKGIAHHYLGNYEVSDENLKKAQPYLRGLSDNILNRLWYVFSYINDLHNKEHNDKEDGFLDECLNSVRSWAEPGPILKPYLALMLAEKASHLSSFSEARRYYLDAIDASYGEKFILLEAFLQQRFAELLIRHQHNDADLHLMRSAISYRRCGADVKAKQIIEKYSIIIPEQKNEKDSETALAQLLDVNYLQKATAEITQHLDLNPLMITIVKAIMERLGAINAYLLMVKDKELKLQAKGIKKDHINVQLTVNEKEPINANTLSMAVVNYVYRTGNMMVLDNASKKSDFQADITVVNQQLKSILCLPVIKHSKVLGILYLENSLIASIFSQKQIELARLLISQAAITLENALLIGEMKQNHDEIQRSKDNLEITLNSIGDAVISTDASGYVTRMNPVAEKLTGWHYKEAIGIPLKTVFPIINATNRKPIDNPVDKVLATGETIHLSNHTTLIAKDKTEHQIADSAAPIHNGDNKILGVIMVFNDVTEAYQLREEVKSAQQQMQGIFNEMQTIVGVMTNTGILTFTNNIPLKLADIEQEHVLGKKLWDCPWFSYDPEIQAVIKKDFSEACTGKNIFRDIQISTSSGLLWIEFSIHPAFNDKGHVIQLVSEGRDISERKIMEEKLRIAEERWLFAIEGGQYGVWDWDFKNNTVFFSSYWKKMLGYEDNEIGDAFDEWEKRVHPDDKKQCFADIERHFSGETDYYQNEHRLLCKDGKYKWILDQGKVILWSDDHKPLRVIGTHQDISMRIQQEEQLRRAQKIDALGKLTGGVAHDYNNMLGVVTGYSELLESMLGDQPKLAKYAHEILNAGQRGAKLTKKLLSFSKQTNTNVQRVNINTLLLQEKDMLEKTLTARIKLVFNLADNLWPIRLNYDDLENAVLNMSINAMHAIKDYGKISFQTHNKQLNQLDAQQLNLDNAGDYVVLSITDTGHGMDAATKEKIFDPFFSTKGNKGTGLGLSQVYGFIERSHGAIKVYSEPKQGTKLVLYFPRDHKNEHKVQLEKETKTLNFKGNESILIVDDEPALRDLSREILSQKGYKIFCAEGGKQALEILSENHIDLMLSDVIMPDTDGYKLASIVQNKYPKIIIQMISGFSDSRKLNNVDKNLHQNLLEKPFTSQRLLQRVWTLLNDKNAVNRNQNMVVSLDYDLTRPIEWTKQFSVDIKPIDQDHKQWIVFINHCINVLNNTQQYNKEVRSILDELIAYSQSHFQREELLMKACEYPNLVKHQMVHQFLLKEIRQRIKEFENGRLTARGLSEFLISCLTNHVMGMDKAIIPYCIGKETIIEQALDAQKTNNPENKC